MDVERRTILLGAAAAGIPLSRMDKANGHTGSSAMALPRGASSHFVEANGVKLHYVTVGNGPPVVLLHGWPETWFAWRGVMERLADRFTLIAPDLRGIGLSERTASGYDKRTLANDIAALITKVAGGSAYVVGHDMGGKVAFMLAYLHPTRVKRLVMIDCVVPGKENGDVLRGGPWHYAFHIAPEFPEMLTQGREQDYIRAQIKAWSHRKDAISEEAIAEYARHYARPGGMTAGFNLYRAFPQDAEIAASFGDRQLEIPVLTVGGRYGVEDALGVSMRTHATNLVNVVAEQSGHFVAEEETEFFCDQVSRFLTS